jgi:hypothetical protein
MTPPIPPRATVRNTIATRRSAANLEIAITTITRGPTSVLELSGVLGMSLSGTRKYTYELQRAGIIQSVDSERTHALSAGEQAYVIAAQTDQVEAYVSKLVTTGPAAAPRVDKSMRPPPAGCHRHLIRDDNEVSTHVPRERFRGQHIELHEAFFGRVLP